MAVLTAALVIVPAAAAGISPVWLAGDVKKATNKHFAFEGSPDRIVAVRCMTQISQRDYYCILRLNDGARYGAHYAIDRRGDRMYWHVVGPVATLR